MPPAFGLIRCVPTHTSNKPRDHGWIIDMKTHTGKTLSFFLAILLFSACLPASATPKAAEHENAAVTMGADVERPRLSTKPATALTTADKKSASTKNR